MENNKEQKINIVVDTSAVIEMPELTNRLTGAIHIPLTVIKQLDCLKDSSDPVRSTSSRQASRFIEEGIKAGRITVLTRYDEVEGVDNTSDNKIVGAAVRLARINPGEKVVLLTTDRNMRLVAAGYGIKGMDLGGIPLRATNIVNIKVKYPIWLRFMMLASILAASTIFILWDYNNGEYDWVPGYGIGLLILSLLFVAYYRIKTQVIAVLAKKDDNDYKYDYRDYIITMSNDDRV